VYGPDTSAGFDYAVEYNPATRTPGDDDSSVNGNDVDFQFPFYGYVEWDDSLGAIPGTVELSEVLDVNYGGIALSDISADWTKFTAPYGPGFDPVATLGLNPAAAYFTSETQGFGDISTASYGDGFGPNLVFNNDSDSVATEAIAHWAQGTLYGGSPAYLAWAMFPGHKSVKYNAGNAAIGYYAEGGILWEDFIRDHDIQTGRNLAGYLRSDYSFTTPGEGRTVDYDYGGVIGFNGDMNRNGTIGEAADKFPVRVRFFTDVDAYDDYFVDGNGYPNYQPDGDTFIEGGCYLTDVGDPNYPVQIFDDVDEEDPLDTVSGTGPDYDVDLFFEIAFGQGSYDVELDWAYDFVSFGNSGHTATVGTYPTAGKWGETVNIDPTPAGGNGNYTFALQVTDSSIPSTTDEFFWPDQVPLFPGWYFGDTMAAYATTADALAAGWTRSSNNATTWYIGPQWDGFQGSFNGTTVSPTVIGEWQGQMWHCNDGTGLMYQNNAQTGLRSPAFTISSGSPWLHYRVALDMEVDIFEHFYAGGSNGAAASADESTWTYGRQEVSHNGLNGFAVNTTPQRHYQFTGAPAGPGSRYVHFRFESDSSVNFWSGSHLDGIYVTDGNFPPIGS
jgi:hypothetical protein